jgi:hypothetical protein
VALQTSIACHLSTHKPQELQKSSNMIIDSEHVIRKSPHSSTLDSVPLSPTNNNCSSNSNTNNNNTVIASSPSTAYSSTNPSVSLLSRNGGNLVRTFVMNGSLQSESAPCNKVSGLVNGPISLLKDKQACASSLTNPSQQNGEFKCSNNNNSGNNNHHNNNNCNVKEDTNVVSSQCQKTCAGFGGAVVHHSSNSNSIGNSSNSNNNTNSSNSSSGNKCAGGTTNQIVTTKVVKPG